MQVVPETPFLGRLHMEYGTSSESPGISGLVHRRNSGFAVPETPAIGIGGRVMMDDVRTVVEETPLLQLQ